MSYSTSRRGALFICAVLLTSFPGLCYGQKGKETKKETKKSATPSSEKTEAKETPKSKDKWIAFVGGTVWPVAGPVIRNGVVVIKNDKIEAVGSRSEVKPPKDAEIVDCKGKHVCPGFVAAAARGALGVRGVTTKEKAADRFDPFSETMLFCLATGITCAHEAPGGRSSLFAGIRGGAQGMFAGSAKGTLGGVIGKLTRGTTEGFALREPAGVYMTWSTNSLSQNLETREALAKAFTYKKKYREWLAAFIDGKKTKKDLPKSDAVTKALAQAMEGDLPLFMVASDQRSMRAVLKLSDRFDLPMVIAGGQEAWTMAPEIGRRPVKMLITPRGPGSRTARPYRNPLKSADHGWSIENAAYLSRTGIAWGTVPNGTGIMTFLFPGRDLMGLPMEACFAVRGGASNDDALRSITLTAAEILGVADRVGSLEAGKDADLLVMDLEPLDYRSFAEKVYVNGRLAYDKSKVDLWSHIRTRRSDGMRPWQPWGPWPKLKDRQDRPKGN